MFLVVLENFRQRQYELESVPAKAINSAAPPSLLNNRTHTEKESQPGLLSIGRFLVTHRRKKCFRIESGIYSHLAVLPKTAALYDQIGW